MLDTKVDGILGYEFFVGRIVEIDYAKKEIGILPMFTLDDGFISCDLTFDGMRPFLRAEVELPDGTLKSGKFLLDTGANDALSVGESFAKIYKLTVETGRPTGGVGGIRLGKSTAIKSLRIGPLSFDVRKPAVQPSRADEGDGLIGSGLLRGRRLVIDYDRKKAYISR